MELENKSPKKRRTLRVFIIGLLLLVALLPWLFSSTRDSRLTWLGPTDLQHPPRPEILRKIKYEVLEITKPVRRYFLRNQNSILTEATIFTMSPLTADKLNLGIATSTNSDGLRAWILPPDKMAIFKHSIEGQPLINTLGRPRIQSSDGQLAQLRSIQALPTMLTNSIGATNYVPVGMTVDLISKMREGSVSVSVGVTSTEVGGWSPDGILLLKTNLALGCRALIPNSGGLLLEGSRGTNIDATNYWFALTSTAIDSQGRPIKHP